MKIEIIKTKGFKVGRWYKDIVFPSGKFCLNYIDIDDRGKNYGLWSGKWVNSGMYCFDRAQYEEMGEDEIFLMLHSIALKGGFCSDGERFWKYEKTKFSNGGWDAKDLEDWSYFPENDHLIFMGGTVYKKGVWFQGFDKELKTIL